MCIFVPFQRSFKDRFEYRANHFHFLIVPAFWGIHFVAWLVNPVQKIDLCFPRKGMYKPSPIFWHSWKKKVEINLQNKGRRIIHTYVKTDFFWKMIEKVLFKSLGLAFVSKKAGRCSWRVANSPNVFVYVLNLFVFACVCLVFICICFVFVSKKTEEPLRCSYPEKGVLEWWLPWPKLVLKWQIDAKTSASEPHLWQLVTLLHKSEIPHGGQKFHRPSVIDTIYSFCTFVSAPFKEEEKIDFFTWPES